MKQEEKGSITRQLKMKTEVERQNEAEKRTCTGGREGWKERGREGDQSRDHFRVLVFFDAETRPQVLRLVGG